MKCNNVTRIIILMAVFNGEVFLQEQLDSFLDQADKNWDLLVSDDGSTDGTIRILERFKRDVGHIHQVTIMSGPKRGAANNFLFLIKAIPEGTELVAFSDQDDVWLPNKLEWARNKITGMQQQESAILYAANSFVCDQDLSLTHSPSGREWKASAGNSFVQSIGGGNTMMMNGPAICLLRGAAHEVSDVVVHDWWTYQVVACCGGSIVRDTRAVLHYRQHDSNLIGSNTSIRGKIQRLMFISDRRFVKWNDKNIEALRASRHRFTPQAKRALSYYAAARHGSLFKRLVALYKSGAVRQGQIGNLALYLACIAKKL